MTLGVLGYINPIFALTATAAQWSDALNTYGGYGTPFTSIALNSIESEVIRATDEGRISGAIEESLAVFEGFDLKLNEIGMDFNFMNVITNFLTTSSGSGSGQVTTTSMPHDDNPYFGLIVVIRAKSGKQIHLSFPKVQVQKDIAPTVSESAEFMVAEMELKAMRLRLSDGVTLVNAGRANGYPQAQTPSSDFDTWFGIPT